MQEADHQMVERAVAVLGDFSGREWIACTAARAPLPDRLPHRALHGGLDDCIRAVAPRVDIDGTQPSHRTLEFVSLDCFRPSALAERLPTLSRRHSANEIRRALHHPAVRSLEAIWRGVSLLVARLRGSPVRVFLFDVTVTELERSAAEPYEEPGLNIVRMLHAATDHDVALDTVIWLAEHAAMPRHVQRLIAVAQLAARHGFVVVTAAHPSLAALDATALGAGGEAGRLWRELRAASDSEHLQLLMPRFLLRVPYGVAGGTEAELFDELPLGLDLASVHARLLWGNPALLAGIVLGRGTAATDLSVAGLPSFTSDGAVGPTLPIAESLLAEESALHLLRSGVTPLIFHQGENAVRLAALRSVSAWGAPLRATAVTPSGARRA